ncbi:MAG: VOC family protein [Saprospiraceae bacterium]|nr:VOC family protein [Saprospiraceae bacterium]
MVLKNPNHFLDQLFAALAEKGIVVETLFMDHICYRVASKKRYEELKAALLQEHQLLAESMIKGRPICTFKLSQGFEYHDRLVDVLELPSPKEGKPYEEGYEHVEFVLNENFSAFMDQYPYINFDQSGMDKPLNADIRLQLGRFVVKFHLQSLERVIEIEKEMGII